MTRRRSLTSNDYFSVDGSLIAARASNNSVRRKDGSDDDNPDDVGRNGGATSTARSVATRHMPRAAPRACLLPEVGVWERAQATRDIP